MNTSLSSETASSSIEGLFTAAPTVGAPRLKASYRLLFQKNPLPMWVYDVQTLRILAANEAALALYGYSRQAFLGLTLLDLHGADDAQRLRADLELAAGRHEGAPLWRHKKRNGDFLDVEIQTEDYWFENRQARVALVRDLTHQRNAERAQRELTERLTTTLESITDAFFTLDRDGRFSYLNSQAQEMLRMDRAQLLGRHVLEMFPESAGTLFETECQRAASEGRDLAFEAFYAPTGEWRAVHVYPSEQGLAVYCRDITEKRLIEQRLLEEKAILSAVIAASGDAMIGIDIEGQIKMFNAGAERIFGRSCQSMLGQNLELLLPERYRGVHPQHLRRFAQSRGDSQMMGMGVVKGLRADAQEIDLEGTLVQVTLAQGQMLIACLRDVTERVRINEQFQASRAQLAELTHRLMTQEKTLVKRLAQALHDQLGQTMAAIRMAHETVMTLQKGKTPGAIARLQAQMGTLINQGIRQVRQVLVDLRPPLLEEQGLAAALDNELRNRSLTQPLVDISMHVAPDLTQLRWPGEVEYAAFMVVREAVENALRHSGASLVAVHLSGSALSLQLVITDNGVGINEGATTKTGHLGILGMRERAQGVGAAVTVASDDGGGTRVWFGWQSSTSSLP